MGRAGIRCGRSGGRSAGVVEGAGLACGDMGEDCLDERGCLDARKEQLPEFVSIRVAWLRKTLGRGR